MNRILIYILVLANSVAYSQVGFYVDGGSVTLQDSTLLHVRGDVEIMLAGEIEDSGVIELTEHWINNSGDSGLIHNAPGIVRMIGGNQYLMGQDPTYFYNLELRGTVFSDIKEAYQNQFITNILDIDDRQLKLHTNTVHLMNTDPTSLIWAPGFGYVSGDSIGGYLARSTDRTATYRFPLGDEDIVNTSTKYRAVDVVPSNGDSNVYASRLAYIDPTNDNTGTSFTGAFGPYDRTLKEDALIQINPTFYHHVVRMEGNTPATSTIYFFEEDHIDEDTRLDGLSNWDKNDFQWEFQPSNFGANITGPSDVGSPEYSMTWVMDNERDDPFALTVMEGILVYVPQIFSPNGDGFNDIMFVRGRKIKEVTFIIYNRWGEKVFETKDKNIGWNGEHRGKPAQSSVYVYYVDADVEDEGRIIQKGNITLVR